jgi:hypothetical protein
MSGETGTTLKVEELRSMRSHAGKTVSSKLIRAKDPHQSYMPELKEAWFGLTARIFLRENKWHLGKFKKVIWQPFKKF